VAVRGRPSGRRSPQAPPDSPTVADQSAWAWKAPPGPDGRASFAASQLPVLVSFDGAPSLATVKVVDAAHLDAAFGPACWCSRPWSSKPATP
jgi:hypothetical protein